MVVGWSISVTAIRSYSGAPPARRRRRVRSWRETSSGFHTGGCASVHRHLELAPGARERIDEICDLIARSRDFTGSYLGLEVQRTETFDAVPDVFPDPASQAWVDRPGVLFDYKLRFERQDLYGTAIVWQKEGAWRLAFVW